MTSSEWAAWVQAVGSIIAVGVAIYVPVEIHRRQEAAKKQSDLLVARDRALHLIHPLRWWIQQTAPWSDALARNNPADDLMVIGWVGERHGTLALPDPIAGMRGRFHELGPAAQPMQRLVYLQGVVELDRDYMTRFFRSPKNDEVAAQRIREHFAGLLRKLFITMNDCEDALNDLLADN